VIRVKFYHDDNDNINGFRVEGHAGYKRAGEDIICSAVSILSQNTINSIEVFSNDEFNYELDEDGMIELHLMTVSDSSKLLLKSFELGIKGIVNDYGNKYVSILN